MFDTGIAGLEACQCFILAKIFSEVLKKKKKGKGLVDICCHARHGTMSMAVAMVHHDFSLGDALSHGDLLDFHHAISPWRCHGRFLTTLPSTSPLPPSVRPHDLVAPVGLGASVAVHVALLCCVSGPHGFDAVGAALPLGG